MLAGMQPRTRKHARRASILACGALAVVLAAGCGDSDKPGYCSDLAKLQTDVKGVSSALSDGGVTGLKTQLSHVKADAVTLVSSAKSDFPDETAALDSSVTTLESSIKALPSQTPSAAQIAGLATEAAAVVTAATDLAGATKDACD
jgi:hypothetical protein